MTTITIKIDHDPDVKVNVQRVEVKSDDPDRLAVGLVDAFIDRPTVQRRAERRSDGLADGIDEFLAERDFLRSQLTAERERSKLLGDRLGAHLAERGDLLADKDRIVGDLKAAKERASQLSAELKKLRSRLDGLAAHGSDAQRSRIAGLEAVAADANRRASNNLTDARNAEDELRKVKRLAEINAPLVAEVVAKWDADALELPSPIAALITERAEKLAKIAEDDIPF